MSDLHNWHDSADEVEAMLLAAGGYVRPADDLRPRVLEAARAQRRERRAQRWIRGLAAAVVLTAGGAALVDPLVAPTGERGIAWRGITSQSLFADAEERSDASGGLSWGVVDAFRELREEQREALRP
jgi:hypothetical protein